jgi:hypothetical protein
METLQAFVEARNSNAFQTPATIKEACLIVAKGAY